MTPRRDRLIHSRTPIRGLQIEGAAAGTVRVGHGAYRIGREADADIALSDADHHASRFHAVVYVAPEGVWLENRSQNGTWLNGEPVVGAQVRTGDVIRCGSTELKVQLQM